METDYSALSDHDLAVASLAAVTAYEVALDRDGDQDGKAADTLLLTDNEILGRLGVDLDETFAGLTPYAQALIDGFVRRNT